MKLAACFTALIVGAFFHAQQATPTPHPATQAPAKPPTLTHEQKEAYWKAVAQQQGAQKNLDAATATTQQAINSMVATCGADSNLQAPNGDPECVAKPKAEEKKP